MKKCFFIVSLFIYMVIEPAKRYTIEMANADAVASMQNILVAQQAHNTFLSKNEIVLLAYKSAGYVDTPRMVEIEQELKEAQERHKKIRAEHSWLCAAHNNIQFH
jgi:hypothetical protein